MLKITALLALTMAASLMGATKARPAVLEGYVRDDSGKPVKGVYIAIDQGSYVTEGTTGVIPLYSPGKYAGVIVINDPNDVHEHYFEKRWTMTDKNGHYSIKRIKPGQYKLLAQPVKRTIWTSDISLIEYLDGKTVANKKLRDRYTFPADVNILVEGGKTANHDLVLQRQ